jgi:hypothetical protein
MVTVCAWCDRFLGPETTPITHGICTACSSRQHWRDEPVLVVASHRQALIPVLRQLLRGNPEIRIVAERRRESRRRHGTTMPHEVERRSGGDRRQQGDLHLA